MTVLENGAYHGSNKQSIAFKGIIVSHNEYSPNSSSVWHCHTNVHFTFILKGTSTEQRKNNNIVCTPGTLLHYAPQEPHCNQNYQPGCKNLSVEINHDWFERQGINTSRLNMGDVVTNSSVKANFPKIFKELCFNDESSKLSIEGCLMLSFSALIKDRPSYKHCPPWLKKVKQLLEDNTAAGLSLSVIAGMVNMHPVTVSREFSKYFGCTFGEYSRKIMVEKAMVLLAKKKLSVSDVAGECGFYDISHFARCFKALTGFTPATYRQCLQ